jgi:hypothetical protein
MDDVELFACFAMGGSPSIGLTCAEIECPPPPVLGACCDPASGICMDDVELLSCIQQGGLFFFGALCQDVECPPVDPTGACCIVETGECLDDVTFGECLGTGGEFNEGFACADLACPPVGACCDPVTNTCATTTQAECAAAGGLWFNGMACDAIVCPGDESCGGANASFETGDLSGWIAEDIVPPFFPLSVGPAGVSPGFGFFASEPTDGVFAALHGWDGGGPGTIVLAQDIDLPHGTTELLFDYRAGWELALFCANLDRTFEVVILPAGGGPPLADPVLVLTAEAGTSVGDTGPLTGAIDVSRFAGTTVRISFEWFVPEAFSGPAFFQLDNIRCLGEEPPDPDDDDDDDGDDDDDSESHEESDDDDDGSSDGSSDSSD